MVFFEPVAFSGEAALGIRGCVDCCCKSVGDAGVSAKIC